MLRLAVLLHDIGKPATRRIEPRRRRDASTTTTCSARKLAAKRLRELRFDNDTVKAVAELIELHLRFFGYSEGAWTDSAVRRYVRDAGDLLEWLHILSRADVTTRNQRKAERARHAPTTTSRSGSPSSPRRRSWPPSAPTSTASRSWRSSACRPGREVGEAYRFLLELRLDEGQLGYDIAARPAAEWWAARGRS